MFKQLFFEQRIVIRFLSKHANCLYYVNNKAYNKPVSTIYTEWFNCAAIFRDMILELKIMLKCSFDLGAHHAYSAFMGLFSVLCVGVHCWPLRMEWPSEDEAYASKRVKEP